MRRLWAALALLAVLLSLILWNAAYLRDFATQVNALLTQAETLAEAGDWQQAEEYTLAAQALWESRETYLHITLVHEDTNEIHVGFREALEFIRNEEGGEYSAANARLMARLELLYQMDEPRLENIL